jgi:RimJ/RimL family protein N-acetyltransferase
MADEKVVSALCQEPEGDVTRSVYAVEFTRENLLGFWEKARQFRTLFAVELNDDFKTFLEIFMGEVNNAPTAKGLLFRIDDWTGAFYLSNIRPGMDGHVHFGFFDRRLRGREELAKEMLQYIMYYYQFRRLTATIPLYVKPATLRFVSDLGFKAEGRMRKVFKYKGDYFDSLVYGLLSEEAMNGRR